MIELIIKFGNDPTDVIGWESMISGNKVKFIAEGLTN